MSPNQADAWPGKEANCMSCHDLEDTDGTLYTAVDGTDSTPATEGDPITVNVNAGDSFELDWYATNITDAVNNYGVGIAIAYPDAWTVAAGTNNTPSLGGWSSAWDNAAGLGTWSIAFDTAAYLPGSDGKTLVFDGSSWDTGSRDSACDAGGACSTGTDLDGTTEAMGGDAVVTVPADTPTGTYTIMLFGVGHDSAQSSDRAHKDQVVNVNVTGVPGTDDTLTVTLNTAVASSAGDGQADIQMQRMQLDCDNVGDGNCILTSVTIDDIGTVSKFDSLDIHIDDDTDFGNGTLGYVRSTSFKGSQSGISLTTLSTAIRTVTNGTSKYVWIIYDISTGEVDEFIQSRVTAVNVSSPDTGATGIWDSSQITVGSVANLPPSINLNKPDGTGDIVTVGDSYVIQYDLSDPDNTVTAAFYYDSNNSGYDGTAISGACATAAEGTDVTCSWDTTGMTAGSYYVYGITNDGTNADVKTYSPGQITINALNAAPALTVDEPNGISDTVTVGDTYNIQYDLADTEETVTAAFYYDSDNIGYDGTAITGACATAAEGTNVTCSWDTTGVTAGTYFVYAIADDGTNPAVKAYSAGRITIDPAASSSGPNNPASSVDDGSNGGAVSWTSPESAATQDNAYANRNNIQNETSHYLKATGFGFAIPGGSAISGILVEVDRYATDASAAYDAEVKIVKGGVVGSVSKAAGGFWPTSDTNSYQAYGSSSDLWGETWTAADINSANFGVVLSAAAGGTKTTVYVDHIRITVYYSSGISSPALSISQPDGIVDTVTVGDAYNITYILSDSDSTVTAAFSYDSDNAGYNGTAITGACATAAEGTNVTCSWDTTGMTAGSYYVYGITNDGTNPDVKAYSPAQITIDPAFNAPPTLTVSEPNGVNDTITVGDSHNLMYTLEDTDDVVTVAMYYDADNAGYDGAAIGGPCATGAEGTNVTCTWETTGMTPGTYYVYGITNDGSNPDVKDYSPGQITLLNTPPDNPTSLAQYRSDGSTVISSGAYTEETTVKIEADISDLNGSDTVKLQVDIDANGSSDCESALVANPSTNVQVSCSVSDGVSYDWQVRTVDNNSATSSWVAFAGTPDFINDQSAPSYTWITPAAGTYYKDAGTISVDATITESGVGITNGAACNAKIDGATSSFTGSVTYATGTGKCTGTLTLGNPSSLTDGAHNLTVEVADDLGNTQASSNRSINIDNSAPAGLGNASPADSATDQLTSVSVAANTATDSGSGSVQYYFEVAEDSGFSVGLQQSGWQAGTSYSPTLANSTTYYWHVKAKDALGIETSYTTTWSFTTGAPNTAPTAPAGHAQYRSDGTTSIANGLTTNETTVVIKATVSDPDSDDTKLEVEIISNASAYTGTANCSSGLVTSGTVATATCSGLSNGTSYKWRARTNDNVDASAWQAFGAADPDVTIKTAMDFGIDTTSNTVPDNPTNLAQYRSNGSTAIASGGYTEEATVKIEADISDPDGADTIKLQVDMDGDSTSDCESALVANPSTNVQVSCSVSNGTAYDWQVRAVDDNGGNSSWVAFAGSPDVTSDQTAPAYTWNTPAAGTYYKDGQGISVDVTITETGSGMTDAADCFAAIVGESGYTGTVNYVQASGKCIGTLTLDSPSGISDGAHDITLDTEDNLSNTQTSAARSINIDNSAPTGLSNATPVNAAANQSDTVNVVANTATDSGSGSVQYYFEVAEDSGFSVGLQQSGWQAGTSYSPTLANSTTYYWHVKAKDALGNETAYTTTWNFTTTIPNTQPDDPTGLVQYKSNGTTVIAQGGFTEETSIIIKASVDDTEAQNVSIEAEVVLNGGSFTGTANCTGGSSVAVPGTAQVTCSGLSGNSYKWRVRAYDGIDYSNWVVYGGSPDVTVDQTAPSYTWNLPIIPTYYADGDTISVDVTITESGVGITNGADCTPLIDGAATEFTGSVTYNDGTGKCTGTLTIDNPSALTDSSHNLTIEVADNFGNTQQSSSRAVDIDNTAPAYTWNTPAAGTYYADGDTISVDVSITETGEGITDGVTCNPKIDGAATEFTGTVTYDAIALKCTGTLTVDNPSALSDGAHNLTVEVADDLGNTQQSSNRSINVDNSAPTGLSNASPADSAANVLVTSSVDANAATDSGSGSVEYFFEVDTSNSFPSPQQSGWQAGTTYAPTLSAVTTYYWHVKARDAMGNETSYTGTWSFDTEAAANNPPDVPADHDQYEVDGTTLIAQGGTNNTTIVKIKATISDADADTVKLEVEMITNGSTYTGTPTCSSSYIASGTVATVTCAGLLDGVSYKWKARTNDGTDTSAWQTFGGSDPDLQIILSGQFDLNSCSSCHAYPPTDDARNNTEGAVVGAHQVTEHDAVSGNCEKCHVKPGATAFNHQNENIEMVNPIHSQTGSFYDKDQDSVQEAADNTFAQSNSPALGTCVATYCHGTGSFEWRKPQLGNYDNCTICHGNPTTGSDGSVSAYKRAPGADGSGVDTNGDSANTDAEVGAHQAHLTAADGISDPIVCGECHAVPSAIGDAGHWDTSGARDAADLTFDGPIGNTDGNDGALSITYSSGQCSNTYCHDGRNFKNGYSTAAQIDFETPTWNSPMISTPDGDGNICDNCHGYPPAGSHSTDSDCSLCHNHVDATDDGFTGATNIAKHINHAVEAQAECVTCHNGVPGGATYVTRDVVGTDFTQSSRHVFGGTVTNWDCIVCHREGDATAASSGTVAQTALHNNGGTPVVDMRNVDSINAGWTWDKNNITDAMHTDMDSFCMGCHDSNGASGINVNASDDGVNLNSTRASTPFNSTDDVSEGVGGGTANVAGYERTAVLDVYTQFDTTNPSHHAVRGTAYNSHNSSWGNTAWVDRTLKSGTRLITDAVYEAAQLHCSDCHTVDQNAHGGSNGFMLQASSIDGTCWLCHNSTTYSNNSSSDTRWDHSNESSAINASKGSKLGQYGVNEGSICLNCHGGNPVTDGFGGIHGLPSGTDGRSGQERYRFMGGSYMSHSPSSWTGTSGGTPTCYFNASSKTQDWSNCTQHNATETGRTAAPQYSRGVPGSY